MLATCYESDSCEEEFNESAIVRIEQSTINSRRNQKSCGSGYFEES